MLCVGLVAMERGQPLHIRGRRARERRNCICDEDLGANCTSAEQGTREALQVALVGRCERVVARGDKLVDLVSTSLKDVVFP